MDMLGKIRRLRFRDGLSISEIVRRTGLSRNTVKSWLKAGEGTVRSTGGMGRRRCSRRTRIGCCNGWRRIPDRLSDKSLTALPSATRTPSERMARMNRLTNKVAIVTGGAIGIGRACVHRMASEGAKVAIFDLLEAGDKMPADLSDPYRGPRTNELH